MWDDGPVFAHLKALTDERGVFEHARFDEPRREHGYCVDDVARALVVLSREPELGPDLAAIAHMCLGFVEQSIAPDGRVRNRMSRDGRFQGEPSSGDCWGRAVWSLGTAAARLEGPAEAGRALAGFHRMASVRSLHLRPMAFAALGAFEVLQVVPGDPLARGILRAAADAIRTPPDPSWPWPERRLRYANAALAEALITAGAGLDGPSIQDRGLAMLRFLLDVETVDGRLSITGTRGRRRGDTAPQFDQQPIEVAALADACARAFELTGETHWREAVEMAWSWFEGDNDSGTPMVDHETGAGFDGLTRKGRNENRGAESTLAMLSTFQQARRIASVPAVAQ